MLTPNERARLREIEINLESDDTRLARLLATDPAGGFLTVRLQQLKIWQLGTMFAGGLLAGPVAVEIGVLWLAIPGICLSALVAAPLLAKIGEWRNSRQAPTLENMF